MFSCKYWKNFKAPIYFENYLPTAASESKAEFAQSMQILQGVVKIYWQTFFKVQAKLLFRLLLRLTLSVLLSA